MSNDPVEPEDRLPAELEGEPPAEVPPEPAPEVPPEPAPVLAEQSDPKSPVTRAGVVWVATIASLLLLILLIVFILQNQGSAMVHFFGLQGTMPQGIALLIAAVGGGLLVAVAGGVRIIQLRIIARRKTSTRRAVGRQSR